MKNATRNHFYPSLICAICLLAFNLSLSAKASPPSDEDPAPEHSYPDTLTPEEEVKLQKKPYDPEPKPIYCKAPKKLPSGGKKYVNIFTTAIGRSGTDEACPQVGKSYTKTNPQYVYCRQKGGVVSDKNGHHNYWWLWTDLDTGGSGWISAYLIKGQGNDQAKGIPNCPK